MVGVIEGKMIVLSEGKQKLLRGSGRFELSGVDCILELLFVIFWLIVRVYRKKINEQINK